MHSRSRLRRDLAGLVTTLALLSATARPLLACEMVMAGAEVVREDVDAAATVADPHAHHRAAPTSGPAEAAPAAPSGTEHPLACDHLINCTVMVAVTAPTSAPAPAEPPDAASRWVDTQHAAPSRAVEPPPPRR